MDRKIRRIEVDGPREFENVFVIAGLTFQFPAAEASIQHLMIRPVLEQEIPNSWTVDPPEELPDPEEEIEIHQAQSRLLATLQTWGPAWSLRMRIKISKLPSRREDMANILHLTTSKSPLTTDGLQSALQSTSAVAWVAGSRQSSSAMTGGWSSPPTSSSSSFPGP